VAGIVSEIREEVAGCRACAPMEPWRKHPPDSFGTTATGYVLVGQCPERRTPRLPLFREALAAVGDPRYRDLEDLFFLTDVVHCQPPGRRGPGREVVRRCSRYAELEIRVLHPRLIVTVGARAAEAVLDRELSIEREHGVRHQLGEFDVLTLLLPVVPSLRKRGLTLESYREWLTALMQGLIAALP
jgi:DNA polymerase